MQSRPANPTTMPRLQERSGLQFISGRVSQWPISPRQGCDERDQPTSEQTEIQFPRVIVEVLSDSTEAYDRGQRFGLYRACSYVQEYVLVATKYESVEVYRRQGQIWTYQAYGSGEEIELASLEIRVSLAALYRGVTIPVMTNEPEGEV